MQTLERLSAQSFPLAGGDAGINQTIAAMRRLIDRGKKDPYIHELAAQLVCQVPEREEMGVARVVGEWVHQWVRYTPDVVGKETLHSAREIVRLRIGDCDDYVILICSLLETVGVPTQIVTVAADNDTPQEFTHVFPVALIDGQQVAVDFARPNAAFGKWPEHFTRMRVYDTCENHYQDVAGCPCAAPQPRARVSGLAGLGTTSAAGSRRLRRPGTRGMGATASGHYHGIAGSYAQMGYFPNALPGAYGPKNLNILKRSVNPTGRGTSGVVAAPSFMGHYGKRAMAAMGSLGQDFSSIGDTIGTLITAGTAGAANIIKAENTYTLASPYGVVSPYGAYGTSMFGGSSYTVNPLTGQLESTILGVPSSLLLGGLAILAVVLVARR